MTVLDGAIRVAAALAPAAILLLYFHERTGARTRAVMSILALGAGSAAAAAALGLQRVLSTLPHVSFSWLNDLPLAEALGLSGPYVVRAFVYGGLVEEGVKWLALGGLLWVYRRVLSPGIIVMLSVAVAVAFAAVENVAYVLNRGDWGRIAFFRAFLSVPAHVSFGAVMALFVVLSRRGGAWRWALVLALLVPAALHGGGNALIALSSSKAELLGTWKSAAALGYAALLATEAALAVLVARCASHMEESPGPKGAASARLWWGQMGMRRFFWSVSALALGLLGAVHVLIVASGSQNETAGLPLGAPLAITVMSLMFAVLFWVHGRPPAAGSRQAES